MLRKTKLDPPPHHACHLRRIRVCNVRSPMQTYALNQLMEEDDDLQRVVVGKNMHTFARVVIVVVAILKAMSWQGLLATSPQVLYLFCEIPIYWYILALSLMYCTTYCTPVACTRLYFPGRMCCCLCRCDCGVRWQKDVHSIRTQHDNKPNGQNSLHHPCCARCTRQNKKIGLNCSKVSPPVRVSPSST